MSSGCPHGQSPAGEVSDALCVILMGYLMLRNVLTPMRRVLEQANGSWKRWGLVPALKDGMEIENSPAFEPHFRRVSFFSRPEDVVPLLSFRDPRTCRFQRGHSVSTGATSDTNSSSLGGLLGLYVPCHLKRVVYLMARFLQLGSAKRMALPLLLLSTYDILSLVRSFRH